MKLYKAEPIQTKGDVIENALFRLLWLLVPMILAILAFPDFRQAENITFLIIAVLFVSLYGLLVDIYLYINPSAKELNIFLFSAPILFAVFLFLVYIVL